jgi:hypothetical protein
MCLMTVMTPMKFSRAEYSADHSAVFSRNIGICAICSAHLFLRARETTARGVYSEWAVSQLLTQYYNDLTWLKLSLFSYFLFPISIVCQVSTR